MFNVIKTHTSRSKWGIGAIATFLIAVHPYWTWYTSKATTRNVNEVVSVEENHAHVLEEMEKRLNFYEERLDYLHNRLDRVEHIIEDNDLRFGKIYMNTFNEKPDDQGYDINIIPQIKWPQIKKGKK